MAKQVIGTGATANDGTGDPLRDGAIKINTNFSEIYTALGNNSSLLFSVDFTTPPVDMQVLQYSSATGKFEPNYNGGQGNTGVGISNATITSGNLIITFSNTLTVNVGTVVGTTGAQGPIGNTGPTGATGNTGVGISTASIVSNNLIITLSNTATINVGSVVGTTGATGPQGPVGNTGPAGAGSGDVNSTGGGYADNAIVRYNGTSGNTIQNSLVTIADDGAITAPLASSIIPFHWANTAVFPSAATYHGAIAHSHANGYMYFAHAGLWVKLANYDDITSGPQGPIGNTGPTGATGNTGVGISTATITSGNLIITLSNTSTINVGTVVGTTGNTGPSGANGATTFAALTDNAGLTVDKFYLPAITRLAVTASGSSAYLFDQYSGNNPTIYAISGTTIAFDLGTGALSSHPFLIRYSGANYDVGLTHVTSAGVVTTGSAAQGKTSGTLYWKIPASISGSYGYLCSNHGTMVGVISIKDISAI